MLAWLFVALWLCVPVDAVRIKTVISVSHARLDQVVTTLVPKLNASHLVLVSSDPGVCANVSGVPCVYTEKSHNASGEKPYFENTDTKRWLWFRQVALDLAFSLSLQAEDEYILFLEDDVIPTANVYEKIDVALQAFSNGEEWHFLNLYSTTPWTFEADSLAVHPSTFHCCTQSFLLNKGYGARIARYLVDNRNLLPPDLLISTLKCQTSMNDAWWPPLVRAAFADSYAMKTFEVVPSLFQHAPRSATFMTTYATHTSPTFVP